MFIGYREHAHDAEFRLNMVSGHPRIRPTFRIFAHGSELNQVWTT